MQSMYSKSYFRAKKLFNQMSNNNRNLIFGYLKLLIHRQVSPNTLRGVVNGLNSFYKYLQSKIRGSLDFTQITKKQIRDYLDYLTDKKLTVATIHGYLTTLKRFFEYLVDEDFMDRVPVLHRYFPKKEFRLPRPMADKDIPIFLSNLKDIQYTPIFLLMLRSGLRISEVCQLKISDVHFEKHQLMVRNGKGKVDRVVYFSLEVQQHLQTWLQKRPCESIYCFAAPTCPDQPIPSITIRKWMEHHLQKNGLSQKGYTPHTLRHYAEALIMPSVLLEKGGALAICRV